MVMRILILALALVATVAMQPPPESSLGSTPIPPVVGMSGGTGPGQEAVPVEDISLVKYAVTQGGLALVLLVVFWSYRRDLSRIEARDQEKLQIVTVLVEKNTAALVNAEATNARLARAVEAHKLVPPGAGV
jgi:hypothetical protein